MTSSPVPPLVPPSLSSDFASDLAAELFPLHSGEQLPLGLLGDDDNTPSMSFHLQCKCMYTYMCIPGFHMGGGIYIPPQPELYTCAVQNSSKYYANPICFVKCSPPSLPWICSVVLLYIVLVYTYIHVGVHTVSLSLQSCLVLRRGMVWMM